MTLFAGKPAQGATVTLYVIAGLYPRRLRSKLGWQSLVKHCADSRIKCENDIGNKQGTDLNAKMEYEPVPSS